MDVRIAMRLSLEVKALGVGVVRGDQLGVALPHAHLRSLSY